MERNLELTIRMDNDHVEIDIYEPGWQELIERPPQFWGPFFIILLTIKMLCGIIQT